MKKIACLILSFMLLVSSSYAQKPSAILVMLKAEKNKITHFEKIGAAEKAAIVRADVSATMQVMINDFTDNFGYCQVYFFVDTNLKSVLDKKFDNVLFDKDRKKYKTSPINATDSSFLIVYYGTPTAASDNEQNTNNTQTYRSVKYPGTGLVVLDHNFRKIKKSGIHYIFEPEYRIFKASSDKRYNYSSDSFDLGYREYASRLEHALKTRRMPTVGGY